jgi:hypothetical protein
MPHQNSNDNTAYNWHPAVHSEHFEETLTFVMVRLHEPLHKPVAEQVRSLLKAAGIKYACAYPLFGQWDALIRVWLTVPARKRLAEVLERSAGHNVEDAKPFTTSEIRYLWLEDSDNLLVPDKDLEALMTTNSSKLDEVAADPEKTDTPAWRHLKKEGLLFCRPGMPKRGVKFYTALTRSSEPSQPPKEIDAIMRAMESTPLGNGKMMSSRSSLYCGSGELAASYLVRCVANKFEDVLALAEAFDMHLEKTGLRPETWIVANPNAVFESDFINNPRHLSQDDSKTARLLGIAPETIAKLSSSNRRALNGLAVEACERAEADSALRETMLAILGASANNNRKDIQDALSLLGPQFEPEFKKRLMLEFKDIYGKNWYPTIKEMCAKSERWQAHAQKRMSEPPRRWTLGTFVKTAQATASIDPKFHGWLGIQLGESWSTEADSAVCLRNDYTHGRVYEMPRYDLYDAIWNPPGDEASSDDDEQATNGLPQEKWADYLRRAMSVVIFSSKIRDTSGRTKGSGDE